ncbi:MAG: hypothetical protein K2K70_08115, partial [Lachnospiraceae bacterium]|nr:hypothetical protein [Lachnospiraceae bacterium]
MIVGIAALLVLMFALLQQIPYTCYVPNKGCCKNRNRNKDNKPHTNGKYIENRLTSLPLYGIVLTAKRRWGT